MFIFLLLTLSSCMKKRHGGGDNPKARRVGHIFMIVIGCFMGLILIYGFISLARKSGICWPCYFCGECYASGGCKCCQCCRWCCKRCPYCLSDLYCDSYCSDCCYSLHLCFCPNERIDYDKIDRYSLKWSTSGAFITMEERKEKWRAEKERRAELYGPPQEEVQETVEDAQPVQPAVARIEPPHIEVNENQQSANQIVPQNEIFGDDVEQVQSDSTDSSDFTMSYSYSSSETSVAAIKAPRVDINNPIGSTNNIQAYEAINTQENVVDQADDPYI